MINLCRQINNATNLIIFIRFVSIAPKNIGCRLLFYGIGIIRLFILHRSLDQTMWKIFFQKKSSFRYPVSEGLRNEWMKEGDVCVCTFWLWLQLYILTFWWSWAESKQTVNFILNTNKNIIISEMCRQITKFCSWLVVVPANSQRFHLTWCLELEQRTMLWLVRRCFYYYFCSWFYLFTHNVSSIGIKHSLFIRCTKKANSFYKH